MSSAASVSSLGSAAASSHEEGPKLHTALSPGDEGDFLESASISLGVFGVLYTVTKEKQLTSTQFTAFRLFLDFLQLWLLVVNPAYGWDIDADSTWWKVISFVQLNSFLSDMGYRFFLAVLYVFIGLLAVNVAFSVWVARSFSQNRFEYVWPIQFLRWFGLIFYQVLDIATLTLLLVTLDCNYFNVPQSLRFHNQEFPDVYCWSMPHLAHAAVSVLSIVAFVVMATAMVCSEMDLNPLTRNYLAVPHTGVEALGFGLKTLLTAASVFLSTSTKVLSLVYLAFLGLLLYKNLKWIPFTYSAVNYLRCASYTCVLYCAVLLVPLAYGPSGLAKDLTLAMWVGMAPAALVGALACHLRLRHFSVHIVGLFRDASPGTPAKRIHRFKDAREVEIAARCCRQWAERADEQPEPQAVELSEVVIKAGITQLPHDPRMIILSSSFLIDVQGSYQSGYTQLQAAKKASPGLLEKFAIFSREQERAQKASGAGGSQGAVDLVSYVEFQRNHRLVLRAHREALLAMRAFWQLLLRTNIAFTSLTKALHRIEVSVKAAERAYRVVLSRHASNARLVRLYGRFLEQVKFDPWAAAKWYTEADRLEEEEEHTKEALQMGGLDAQQLSRAGHSGSELEGVAAILINAQGTIQMATPEAHVLLGYAKNELKGKDVSVMMPPPFGDRHSAYVRNYIQTGTGAVLDRPVDFIAVTKSRQVLPVRITVSKVTGLNEDSVFMGTLEPLPASPDACCWVLGTGTVVAADQRFCDWLGFIPGEVAGSPLEDLLARDEQREALRSIIKGIGVGSRPRAPAGKHPLHQSRGFESAASSKGRRRSTMSNATSIDLGHTHPSPLGAVASGRGASLRDLTAPMRLPRAYWRHKYTEPLCFDTTLLQGEFGSVKVHSVVLRRCSPRLGVGPMSGLAPPSSPYRDMMLVADNRGRIVHVTVALAAALGRSPDTLRAGGLDMIIPEPAAVLHGAWVQELANPQSTAHALMGPPPPFSCRSGIPICLAAVDEQDGPIVRPFRLEVKQRLTQAGSTKLHIVSAWPLSEEQALSQQRMRLTLDLAGNILSVDDGTPAELFGAPPHTFVGQSISEVVDLFRPEAGGSSAVRSAPSTPPLDGDVLDRVESALEASAARRVTRALLELSKRSLDAPGTSWRVGVTLPPDESARQELDQLALLLGASEHAAAERLIGGRTVPAVMRLRLVRKTQHAQQKRAVSMGFDVHEPRMEPLGSAFGGPPPSDADRSHHRAPSWGVQQAPWADKHSMRPGSVAAEPVAEGTRALHRRQAGPSAVAEATEEEMEEVLKHAESVANLQAPQPAAVDPSSAGTPRTAAASRLAAKVSALASEKSRSEAAGSPTGSMRAAALASSRAASRVNLRTSANDVPEAPAPAASRSIILPSPAAAASLAALAAGTSQRRSSHQLRLAGAEGSATVTEAASASVAASLGFESSLMVEVELWRADLLSGVVEVDEKGRLIRKDANSPLTHADLVLGLPATALLGVPAAEVLPRPPGGVAALLDNASGNQEVRGGLKRNGSARASKAGQPVVLPSRHAGDCCGIELRIQAVRRPGPPGSAYLILRPSAPAAAQPGFLRWLHDNDPSGLMPGLPGDKGTGGSGAQQEGGPLGLRLSVRGLVAAGRVAKLMRATAAANKAALLPPKASTTTGFEDRTPLLLAPSSPRARAGLTAVAREATTAPPGGQDALAGSTGADPSRDPPIPLPGTALAQPGPAPLSPAASRALSRVGSRLSLVAPAEPPPVPYARALLVPAGSVSRRQESLGLGNGLAAGVPDSLDTPRNNSGEQSWSLPPGEKTADLLKALEARKIDDERSQNPMDSIQSWVLAGAAAAAAAKGAEESSSSSKPSSPGSEGDCLSDDDMAAATHEADASKHLSESGAEEVESEAGAVTANYSAGKRFKRLNKLLISPMAHRPILVLRNITLALVAILLAAHLATFLLLRAELSLQTEHLEELVSAAQAARRVHELAINGRVLDMLYTGGFEVPGLPQFGEPLEEAVASLYEDILGLCDSFKALHHGVYLGFDHRRRISSQFGLRHIWDDPGLNVTVFYDAALITSANSTVTQLEAPLPVSRLMGLWDAGNEYLKQAFELHNNGEAHVRQGGNFTEWAAWKFIRANGLPVIFPAYLETLDALVQITVAESERIYQLQLIVLSVEGGLLCFMACVAMWIAASSFAHKRFMLYNVFVQIPMGVTRGLANMSIQLGAGEDDDDDELGLQTGLDPLGGGAADGGPPAEDAKPDGTTATQVLVSKPKERRANFGFASSTKEGEPEGPVERTVSAIPGGSGKQGAATGGSAVGARLRGALSGLAFWRHSTKVNPEALSLKSRRRLVPSRRLCYIMVAPFLLWGILVVTINLADYVEMRTLASPIAALNVVNVFAIRFHRILFYVLEVAGALGYTARDAYKAVLRTEDAEWRLEYDVMLFGNEVVPAAGGAPPHFELAGTGLVFGGKEETTYLLFNTNQCLAEDAADCQPQDSPFYQATHHGLDVLVKNQATYVASLLQQPPEGSHINSTEFRFLWATGQTDAEGALNRLRDAYHAEVQRAYEGVKVQQVLLFALAWIWALVFVLLLLQPLLRRSRNEMRRIAELLSQLPAEVDCEGMVIAAISAGGAPLPAGAGGGAPMGGKGAKQGDRRRP